MEVSENSVQTCAKCGEKMKQDEDTFDTWFSSALWPFSTLGWPDDSADMQAFFPTQTLVTAADIIFLWVARMIFSSLEYTGKIPFDTVMFNGLVLDAQGRKMSKSLDNGVDPLEMIDKFGADALRFMLICGNATGNNMRWNEEKIASSRNFANKLWNAARYVLMNLSDDFKETEIDSEKLTIGDKWILHLCNNIVLKDVTSNLNSFELGVAAGNVQDFIWNAYCDIYIEYTKICISKGGEKAFVAQNILVFILRKMLKLLHPFMPFITEEIWNAIPGTKQSIMRSEWDENDKKIYFQKEYWDFCDVLVVCAKARAIRANYNVPDNKKVALEIETATNNFDLFNSCIDYIKKSTSASEIILIEEVKNTNNKVAAITSIARIFMPMGELVDVEKERERLEKEMAAAQADIDFVKRQLDNEKFVAKAPPEQVEKAREKLRKAEEKAEKIKISLEALK